MDLFDLFELNMYKITKPVRLIELFGGYGSQHFAFEYLGVDYEHWKLCEWAVKSIQAYKDGHYKDDDTNYSVGLTQTEVIDYLFKKKISMDYNKPMTRKEIQRLGEKRQRVIYNNIQATKNLVDVQQTKGSDLEIIDTDKYDYFLTYSFPCQDLSLAGLGKGMEKGSGTRSSMLWEVKRILDECENLPQILLMENVPQVHGKGNRENFDEWCKFLRNKGYTNYWKDLNAKDFEIPQNRKRTFMVSVLSDYIYDFPKESELKLRLKDLLEETVDEKFYVSEEKVKNLISSLGNKVIKPGGINISKQATNFDNNTEIAGTLLARDGSGFGNQRMTAVAAREATKKGYAIAEKGDSINISQPNSTTRRGRVGKQIANTLLTGSEQCVVVPIRLGGLFDNEKGKHQAGSVWDKNGLAPTLDTMQGGYRQPSIVETNNMSPTLDTRCDCLGVVTKEPEIEELRIRKLTPKECFRLMGVKDEDYENIAENQSNSSLYHLAGDSIVITVLMAIISMFY